MMSSPSLEEPKAGPRHNTSSTIVAAETRDHNASSGSSNVEDPATTRFEYEDLNEILDSIATYRARPETRASLTRHFPGHRTPKKSTRFNSAEVAKPKRKTSPFSFKKLKERFDHSNSDLPEYAPRTAIRIPAREEVEVSQQGFSHETNELSLSKGAKNDRIDSQDIYGQSKHPSPFFDTEARTQQQEEKQSPNQISPAFRPERSQTFNSNYSAPQTDNEADDERPSPKKKRKTNNKGRISRYQLRYQHLRGQSSEDFRKIRDAVENSSIANDFDLKLPVSKRLSQSLESSPVEAKFPAGQNLKTTATFTLAFHPRVNRDNGAVKLLEGELDISGEEGDSEHESASEAALNCDEGEREGAEMNYNIYDSYGEQPWDQGDYRFEENRSDPGSESESDVDIENKENRAPNPVNRGQAEIDEMFIESGPAQVVAARGVRQLNVEREYVPPLSEGAREILERRPATRPDLRINLPADPASPSSNPSATPPTIKGGLARPKLQRHRSSTLSFKEEPEVIPSYTQPSSPSSSGNGNGNDLKMEDSPMFSDFARTPTKDGFESPLKSDIERESKSSILKLPFNPFSELDISTDRRAAAFKKRAKEFEDNEGKTLRFGHGFVDELMAGKKRKSEAQLHFDRKLGRDTEVDEEGEVKETQKFLNDEQSTAIGRTILPLKKSSGAGLDI